jgi:hypothetical protein
MLRQNAELFEVSLVGVSERRERGDGVEASRSEASPVGDQLRSEGLQPQSHFHWTGVTVFAFVFVSFFGSQQCS